MKIGEIVIYDDDTAAARAGRPLRAADEYLLLLYDFRFYHQVEHIEVRSCAASGCGPLELLDPQYVAYAFAMGEALDIDGQRLPFAGSSDRQALLVIVPLAVLQTAGVGRRRIRAGNRFGGDFEKERGTGSVERFRSGFAGEV